MNPILRGSLKSKTMWLGFAVSAMGYVQTNIDVISQFIPQKYIGLVTVMLGLLIMAARYVTDESLSDKGQPQEPSQ